MGRKRQVGQGTSNSSQVRAVPVFNHPIDRRKLAQAVLALVLADVDRGKTTSQDHAHADDSNREGGDR